MGKRLSIENNDMGLHLETEVSGISVVDCTGPTYISPLEAPRSEGQMRLRAGIVAGCMMNALQNELSGDDALRFAFPMMMGTGKCRTCPALCAEIAREYLLTRFEQKVLDQKVERLQGEFTRPGQSEWSGPSGHAITA